MRRRIVHLIDRAKDTAYFRAIAEHHDRERWEVVIGSIEGEGPLQEAMRSAGVGTFGVGVRGQRRTPLALPGLVRTLGELDPALVHLHTFYASAVGLPAARIAGAPKVVVSRHHSDHLLRLDRPVHHAVDRWVTRHADRVLAVSEATRGIMIEAEGADPDKIGVVYNGVDPIHPSPGFDREAARRALGAADRPILLTVARLHEEKGHRHLLAALPAIVEAVPDVLLVWAGEGEARPVLEARIAEEGWGDRVRLLGQRADVFDLMAAADLFVLPSLAESFGFVLVEAMWSGLPIVAARTGGIPEVLDEGRAGILVPPGDPEALAEAINRVLRDAELRERLAEAGRARAAETFSAKAMVRGYERAWTTTLEEGR